MRPKCPKSGNATRPEDNLELLDYIEMMDDMIFMEYERQLEERNENERQAAVSSGREFEAGTERL